MVNGLEEIGRIDREKMLGKAGGLVQIYTDLSTSSTFIQQAPKEFYALLPRILLFLTQRAYL